jgi:hypothetical protein
VQDLDKAAARTAGDEPEASNQPGGGPMARRDQRDNSTMVRGISRVVCDNSTGDAVELFSPQHKKTPHATLGACLDFGGDAPPPLLVLAGPQCALSELGTLHRRSLWLTVNNLGWVDRHIFREWWFWGWVADMRR